MQRTFEQNHLKISELSERLERQERQAALLDTEREHTVLDGTRPKERLVLGTVSGDGKRLVTDSDANESVSRLPTLVPETQNNKTVPKITRTVYNADSSATEVALDQNREYAQIFQPTQDVRNDYVSEPEMGTGFTNDLYVNNEWHGRNDRFQDQGHSASGPRVEHRFDLNPRASEFVPYPTRQAMSARVPNRSIQRPRYNDDYYNEDSHVRVRQFHAKETDWFSYRSYFEAVATQAGWSDRTKSVKLMAALDGSLIGITTGMNGQITYQDLLAKLDSIHGIENAREDAALKLSSCKKKESETVAMYAERVRQLVERAYPTYSKSDKDEQALRAFLLGFPSKYDMRLKMRMVRFSSLHEAVIYGSNLEHILQDEKQSEKNHMLGRAVKDEDVPGEEKFSVIVDKMNKNLESMVDEKLNRLVGSQPGDFNNRKSTSEKTVFKKTPLNSPCHACGELGHWRNECPTRVPPKVSAKESPLNL